MQSKQQKALGAVSGSGQRSVVTISRRAGSGEGLRGCCVFGAGERRLFLFVHWLAQQIGRLAIFAAMRRASSLLNSLAADRRPGSSSK
jgi:hypothetical protein